MTQAGGPAAINGCLYQIIRHLGWLADVTLSGKLNGQEIDNARLVLEPRSGAFRDVNPTHRRREVGACFGTLEQIPKVTFQVSSATTTKSAAFFSKPA